MSLLGSRFEPEPSGEAQNTCLNRVGPWVFQAGSWQVPLLGGERDVIENLRLGASDGGGRRLVSPLRLCKPSELSRNEPVGTKERSRKLQRPRERASVLDCGDRDARRKPASAAPLSRGAERSSSLPYPPARESGVAPRLAARTPRRFALTLALGFLPAQQCPSATFSCLAACLQIRTQSMPSQRTPTALHGPQRSSKRKTAPLTAMRLRAFKQALNTHQREGRIFHALHGLACICHRPSRHCGTVSSVAHRCDKKHRSQPHPRDSHSAPAAAQCRENTPATDSPAPAWFHPDHAAPPPASKRRRGSAHSRLRSFDRVRVRGS